MASSITEIAKNVQTILGLYPLVSNVSGTDKFTSLFNANYNIVRKAAISAHPWTFTIKRASLTSVDLGATPTWGFTYAYVLPGDYLTLWEIQDERINNDMDFKVEAGNLLINESSVNIKYISDEEDVTIFHPVFDEYLALSMAIKLCYSMTQNSGLKQLLLAEKIDLESSSRFIDSVQSRPDTQYWNEWENSRL